MNVRSIMNNAMISKRMPRVLLFSSKLPTGFEVDVLFEYLCSFEGVPRDE
jgi:hypothetical protein